MSGYSIENFYDTTYTLYRCSPLYRFPSQTLGYNNFERMIAEYLCEQLDLYLEGRTNMELDQPKGKITMLRFQPIELKDFEHDTSNNESPPLLFELEFEIFSRKKVHRQTFLMLPARKIPPNKNSELFWHYPLIITKLSKTILDIIEAVFDKKFDARLELLRAPPKVMENLVTSAAESIYKVHLQDFEYLANGIDVDQFSSLKMEYLTHGLNIKHIRFSIEPDQVLKICKLTKESNKFYTTVCKHIFNTTKINITALQLNSVSCHVASLSVSGKLKIHTNASSKLVYDLIYLLIELAGTRKDTISWV